MKSMCLGYTEKDYEWSVSKINRKIREKERDVYERRDQRKGERREKRKNQRRTNKRKKISKRQQRVIC